jgi:hypothetical protein
MANTLTVKQSCVLLVLADRRGVLTTNELCDLVNAGRYDDDDDAPELERSLGNEAVVAVGRQLAKKGLAVEFGVPFGPKRWLATDAGRKRADGIQGLI